MDGPRPILKNEFAQLEKLVNTCFPADGRKAGMFRRWPHCFSKDKTDNHIIIKDRNRIVSHIACVPQEIIAGNSRIKSIGISAVSTYKQYRGKGLMSRIFKHCIAKIQKEGVPFSYLSGDRQRYNHFGWENGGVEWLFQISGRSLNPGKRKITSRIRRYKGDTRDVKRISSLYNREPFRVRRTPDTHKTILGRKGWDVLIANRKGAYAYMVATHDKGTGTIWEFSCRHASREAFRDLLAFYFKKHGLHKIELTTYRDHPCKKFLLDISCNWMHGHHWMIKVFDLVKTLKCFRNQIKDNCRNSNLTGGVLTLIVKETGQVARIHIAHGRVIVDSRKGANRLHISELDIVKMLFGFCKPSYLLNLVSNAQFIDSIFPLKLFIWRNNGI